MHKIIFFPEKNMCAYWCGWCPCMLIKNLIMIKITLPGDKNSTCPLVITSEI